MDRFNPERLMPQANVAMVVQPEGEYIRHSEYLRIKAEQAMEYLTDTTQQDQRIQNLMQHLERLLRLHENRSDEEAKAIALQMLDNPPA